MPRLASLLLGIVIVALGVDGTAAASIYRWQDAAGGWHFSNRAEAVAGAATQIDLAPLPVLTLPRGRDRSAVAATERAQAPRRHESPCAVGDAGALAAAVGSRLAAGRRLGDLTLLVAGVPVAQRPGTTVTLKSADAPAELTAPVEPGAIAYPAGTACPSRPPLSRYAVASSRRAGSGGLCDDFQRTFAEVGVAVSRDQGVARSFRAIAENFVAVEAAGYVTGGAARPAGVRSAALSSGEGSARVRIPPWVVEAHIAQTRELAEEAADFVDDLTAALEEIDAAARARGCW